ncbi:hypothetical protein [Pseudomonas sp. CBS]
MSLTLRQTRYFVATAEIGQISQAAIHTDRSHAPRGNAALDTLRPLLKS